MKFKNILLCILVFDVFALKLQGQTFNEDLLRLEYDVWQAKDAKSQNEALLIKLSYQLNKDTSSSDILQTFNRLNWKLLEPIQQLQLLKNRTVFHYKNKEWEAAAQSFYEYMSLKPRPTRVDSMQYYFLNSLALGDFSTDTGWLNLASEGSINDCFECLKETVKALNPPQWPKYLNYLIPGSGMMTYGQWATGAGSLLLNAMGVTGGLALISAALPVNALVWAGSWEILFYGGSHRALSNYQLFHETQKKAGLNQICQARWEEWIQTLVYEPFI